MASRLLKLRYLVLGSAVGGGYTAKKVPGSAVTTALPTGVQALENEKKNRRNNFLRTSFNFSSGKVGRYERTSKESPVKSFLSLK